MKTTVFVAMMALVVALSGNLAFGQGRTLDRSTMQQELTAEDRDFTQRFEQTNIKYIPSTQSLDLKEGRPVIVDVASRAHFLAKHIQGAINIPAVDVERLMPIVLPDKDSAIVIYNSDPQKGASVLTAEALVRLGYNNLRVYGGSLESAKLPVEGTTVKKQAETRDTHETREVRESKEVDR